MASLHPTIVIIPGGWHVPATYDAFTEELKSRGFEVRIPDIPSVNDDRPPPATLTTDTKFVRNYISTLIEKGGREVIAIGHSYGGVLLTNSLYGLAQKAPGEPGISNIVYLASTPLLEQGSMVKTVIEFNHMHRMPAFITEEDGSVRPADPRLLFYNNESSPEIDASLATLKLWNAKCMADEITHAAWRDISTTQIFTTKDFAIPVEYQRSAVKKVREAGAKVQTAELDTGHNPFATKTKELTDIVEQIATGKFVQGAEVSLEESVKVKHPYDPED